MKSAVFLSFNGNCQKAFELYQSCFGGALHFNFFEKEIKGYTSTIVVSATLHSTGLVLYGSDLAHNEGRRAGNQMAIYIECKTPLERVQYMKQLQVTVQNCSPKKYVEQRLIEVEDQYGVRWVFGVLSIT